MNLTQYVAVCEAADALERFFDDNVRGKDPAVTITVKRKRDANGVSAKLEALRVALLPFRKQMAANARN